VFVSDPLDIIYLIDAKVAAVRGIVARSKEVVVSAKEDLDKHERWLQRHRVLCLEDLKRHQHRLKRQRTIRACKQTAMPLVLLVPSLCVALFRGAIWALIYLRDLLSISFSWIGVKAHALGLSLEEIIEQQFSQLLVRLGFDDEALDGARDAICANHADEKRKREAAFVRLRAEHERLQNRIHAMDKLYGRRFLNGGRATGVSSGVCQIEQNHSATSHFSPQAIRFAQGINQRLILINGDELTRLLVQYGVGVRGFRKLELQRVDTDYFEEPEL
jgi:hypothetical protein